MSEVHAPIDPQLSQLFRKILEETITQYVNNKQRNVYLNRHSKIYKLSYRTNGLPEFNDSYSDAPIDYSTIFGTERPAAFADLLNYSLSNERLRTYYELESNDPDQLGSLLLYSTAADITDTYLNTYGEVEEIEEEKFLSLYLPLEKALFAQSLDIDIVVPILMLTFDFDEVKIADNAFIVRMSESLQVSRARKFEHSSDWKVITAATHALVLRNWSWPNTNYLQNVFFTRLSEELLSHLEYFWAALRVICGHTSGYAQVLYRPIDWVLSYRADLEPLYGTNVKSYSPTATRIDWYEADISSLSTPQAEQIGKLYSALLKSEKGELKVAIKRLNRCLLRAAEDDSILDAAIGLEALLLSDGNSEMAYKLAVRLTMLSRLSETPTSAPQKIFRDLKKIYDYRSSVIHGNTKLENKREITDDTEKKVPTVSLAIEYLRMAIHILASNPQYIKGSEADDLLTKIFSQVDRSKLDM